MRIGHFCSLIWAPGGIATYIRRVSDAQRAQGDEVVFLTGADDAQPSDGDERVAERVSADGALLRRAAELRLDVLHTYTEVDADLVRSSVPVVRTVMVHTPYCPSGSRYLRRWGKPCERAFSVTGCMWGHLVDRCGSARPNRLVENFARTRVEQRSLAGVRVIAISEFVREQMIRNGYDPAQIDMMYLPIRPVAEPAPIDPAADNRPRILYAGRLTPAKGVDWLLRAFARTAGDAVLEIVGAGDEADALQALAARLGMADKVHFVGWADEASVDRLMARARAVVFPSVWHEPFGLVAVEAMACGVPVIGSRVGAIPETVRDGHNGLLVDPNDVPGLASAIDRLVADPSLAAKLGRSGRRDAAERFGLADHVRQLSGVYTKAIDAGRDRHRA